MQEPICIANPRIMPGWEKYEYAKLVHQVYYSKALKQFRKIGSNSIANELLIFEFLNLVGLRTMGFHVPDAAALIDEDYQALGYQTVEVSGVDEQYDKLITAEVDIEKFFILNLVRFILGDKCASEDGNIIWSNGHFYSIDVESNDLSEEDVSSEMDWMRHSFADLALRPEQITSVIASALSTCDTFLTGESEATLQSCYDNPQLVSAYLKRVHDNRLRVGRHLAQCFSHETGYNNPSFEFHA